PASTVFRPIRRLKGQKSDPANWSEGEPAGGPSLITIEEAALTKTARCKDIHVQKIKDRSSSRSDGHVLGDDELLYAIDDVANSFNAERIAQAAAAVLGKSGLTELHQRLRQVQPFAGFEILSELTQLAQNRGCGIGKSMP
ncbi:MAG TPA: hypothetical protein VKG91_14970, partial [Roseiarcus sp.]|nr:hypothetical protein [Roseiarcus sp.]